tara:strand:- start:599 stop:964 length:366 start_codon:yes stop_codon:yes gene_type:complete
MGEAIVYVGTAPKIPFTVEIVPEYEWFSLVTVTVEGLLNEHGDKDTLTLHLTVGEDEQWEKKVRSLLAVVHQVTWQLQGTLHHNAKLTEAVSDAFRVGKYVRQGIVEALLTTEVENEDATV